MKIKICSAVMKLDEQVEKSKSNIFHNVDNLEPCSSISLYSMKLTILTPHGEVERLKGQRDLSNKSFTIIIPTTFFRLILCTAGWALTVPFFSTAGGGLNRTLLLHSRVGLNRTLLQHRRVGPNRDVLLHSRVGPNRDFLQHSP